MIIITEDSPLYNEVDKLYDEMEEAMAEAQYLLEDMYRGDGSFHIPDDMTVAYHHLTIAAARLMSVVKESA